LAAIAVAFFALNSAHAQSGTLAEIKIDASQTREPISKYIYGQFIEHLGRCIYGGIWAEMLEDRKFYYDVPAQGSIWRTTSGQARVLAASPWKVLGPGGTVRMNEKDPFSGKHSPEIHSNAGADSGVYQEELGLVKGKTYTGYIILAGASDDGKSPVPVAVRLIWGPGDKDREMVMKKSVEAGYTKLNFKFTAGATTDNGRLEIATTGKGRLRIGCVSLMPGDNVDGFRRDTLDLLKQLNAPVYRWPGGNFVSGYDWRDGLGDRDRRPTRTNPAWTGIEPNDVGMHEFIHLCELIKTEPMIAVNTGFGDAYSAAAEVEYANGAVTTPMGKLRAANGSTLPFAIKWWCVGNEMWGRWQLGYMQQSHYVLKHNWVEEKMRSVDPTIHTVASGDLGNNWSRGMLTNCMDHMDLISEHFYSQTKTDLVEHVRQIPDNIKRIADAHRQFRKELPQLKGKDIRIALDEWNYWYGPHVFGELGTRYFLKDALGIAEGLHEYFRSTDVIFMANYAQTVNVIGCIKTTKTHADFDSTAMPLVLYRKNFGTIPVSVEQNAAPLDVAAALTTDKRALTIGLVNPQNLAVPVKVRLSGMRLSGKAQAWTISGDDLMAFNQPGEPRKVDIKDAPAADLNNGVTLKPYSITLWKVPVQ
jgi:alpha-N-arabinofuranosidase